MITACWSVKGGSGVTATAIALATSKSFSGDCVLVDIAGDIPMACGVSARDEGIGDWLRARDSVGTDGLKRLQIPLSPRLSLIAAGTGLKSRTEDDATNLLSSLSSLGDVIVDVGMASSVFSKAVARQASQSLLVTRACYLATQKAVSFDFRPSGIVLVSEAGRALGKRDLEDALGVDVIAEIPFDPAISRSLDAGLLHKKLPRTAERALRSLNLPLAS